MGVAATLPELSEWALTFLLVLFSDTFKPDKRLVKIEAFIAENHVFKHLSKLRFIKSFENEDTINKLFASRVIWSVFGIPHFYGSPLIARAAQKDRASYFDRVIGLVNSKIDTHHIY